MTKINKADYLFRFAYEKIMQTIHYPTQVRSLLKELGIAAELPASRGLQLWLPPPDLVTVGYAASGKALQLTPKAAAAWQKLQLAAGLDLPDILSVLAPPGFSEHHSGAAVDIGSPDCKPLDAHFDAMPAYAWLSANANRFGFFLSFPKDNVFGFIYEPWHWRYWENTANPAKISIAAIPSRY